MNTVHFYCYYLLFVPTNAHSCCPLALCVVAADLNADIFGHELFGSTYIVGPYGGICF